MTSAVLGVAALLIGFVALANMSIWCLPAAIAVTALGAYGLLLSGKHHERFKYHLAMMRAIREEMDRVGSAVDAAPKSLIELKAHAEREHYFGFVWPKLRSTRSKPQALATSWIARQRLHMFWESAHAGIAVLGLMLCLFILVKAALPSHKEPTRVEVTKGTGT